MTFELETLRRLIHQCDPVQPLYAADPRYVRLDDVRGESRRTCVESLYRTILLRERTSCQLFTGFPGTGKTTELRQLERRLSEATDLPTRVIFVDFSDYLDLYSPLTIIDVLRILAFALDREATLAEGEDPDTRGGYSKRFFDIVKSTSVRLKELNISPLGASLILELKNNPTFREQVDAALRGRFQQFAEDAEDSMEESVRRLRKAVGAYAHRIVILADSLEKLSPLRDEDRASMEQSVEMVFLSHSRFLRTPCHIVYTFPLWLRHRRSDLGADFDAEPLVLPMVKVSERDGTSYQPGLARLIELVDLRVGVNEVFGSRTNASIERIVRSSGGYPRDLLRLVRAVLSEADTFPVDERSAERATARLAEDYRRTLFQSDMKLLCDVATTRSLPREGPEQLAAFGRLLERFFVLAYRNGSEWYDIHPLLREDPLVVAYLRNLARDGS